MDKEDGEPGQKLRRLAEVLALSHPKCMPHPGNTAVGTGAVSTVCLALLPWDLICSLKGSVYAQCIGTQPLKSVSCFFLLAPVRPWANYLTLDPRFPHVQNGDNNGDSFIEV